MLITCSNRILADCLVLLLKKKVEDVVFYCSYDSEKSCKLPAYFYTCSSLLTLSISSCSIGSDMLILWKSLKSIKLGPLELSDEEIVNLLSGCPALEIMELCSVRGFNRLHTNSLKLKRLKLGGYLLYADETDHSLEIVIAPYVQHLEILGDLYYLKCRLVDVSSVVNAKLTFNIKCIKDILGYRDEHFDDEEDSCRDYHQVLCMLLFKGVPFPELKCKYLTLELHMECFNLYGAVGLLRASRYVETLTIDIDAATCFYGSWCQFESRFLAEGDNIDLQSSISCFLFPNLKNVKIVNSSGVCLKDDLETGYDKLFKLSEFLLKTATILEKFIIISKTRKCLRCSMNCVSPYLFQLAGKLLGCPRSSTNSKIIIQE